MTKLCKLCGCSSQTISKHAAKAVAVIASQSSGNHAVITAVTRAFRDLSGPSKLRMDCDDVDSVLFALSQFALYAPQWFVDNKGYDIMAFASECVDNHADAHVITVCAAVKVPLPHIL